MFLCLYFSVFDTLWNLGLFWFLKTPPLILNYSQLKLDFLWFLTLSQVSLLFRLESFPKDVDDNNNEVVHIFCPIMTESQIYL